MTTIPNKFRRVTRRLGSAVGAAVILGACGGAGSGGGAGGGGGIQVVAAENFWGSIASQVGASRVNVVSIISNPDTDPHAYEPTPQDARAIAQAQYVIANGAGYDPWAAKLVDANPSATRRVLTIADVAGRKDGDNPHMWYSPTIVGRAIDRIASDLGGLDPARAGSFDQQAAAFKSNGLGRYTGLLASIKSSYSGVPVGATESIFIDLAQELGLDLVTPREYMKAISSGNDPTAGDRSTVDAQISERRIRVLVFNRQNSTSDVQAVLDRAKSQGIPVVAITETLEPATATFQDWQVGQLDALRTALAQATGR